MRSSGMEPAFTRVAILAPFRGGLVVRGEGPDGPFSLPGGVQERGVRWQKVAQDALAPHFEVDPEELVIVDILEMEGGNLLLVGLPSPPASNPSYLASNLYAVDTSDLVYEWASDLDKKIAANWLSDLERARATGPGRDPLDTLVVEYDPDPEDPGILGRAWIEDGTGTLTRLDFSQDGTFSLDTDGMRWMDVDRNWIDRADTLMGQFMRVCDIIDARLDAMISGLPEIFAAALDKDIPLELIEDLLTPLGEAAAAPDAFLFLPSIIENVPDIYVLISDPRLHIETNAAVMSSPCRVRLRAEDGARARSWVAPTLAEAKAVAIDCAAELESVSGGRA